MPMLPRLDGCGGLQGPGLLATTFSHKVSAIEVREDWGVDVAVEGDLLRFG
jgi:hypothetical protein